MTMQLETQQRVAAAFNRAAVYYDETAQMQQRYALDLIAQAKTLCQPTRIIDLGCGTGYNFKPLRQTFSAAALIGVDCAYDMLTYAYPRVGEDNHLIQADLDCLPFAAHSCDLLLCHFALQWSDNLATTLQDFNRVLDRKGCVSIAIFSHHTLHELATVSHAVTGQTRVNPFVSHETLLDLVESSGFTIKKQRVILETLYMTEVIQLMDYLKSLGANTVLQSPTPDGLGGKQRLRAYQMASQAFADERGKLPATFEISLVTAKKQ